MAGYGRSRPVVNEREPEAGSVARSDRRVGKREALEDAARRGHGGRPFGALQRETPSGFTARWAVCGSDETTGSDIEVGTTAVATD